MQEETFTPLVRIVDDEETVRKSESFIFRIIGLESQGYASAEEFLAGEDFRRPGCIVLDMRMGEMSGLELMQELQRRGCDLPVVFLSGHGTVNAAVHALKIGACDFLEKPVKPARLQQIVRELIARNVELRRKKALYASLTEREAEVLRAVARGLLNKQTALELGIAEHTVKIHRANALRKLGIRTVLEANGWLREIGVALEEEK